MDELFKQSFLAALPFMALYGFLAAIVIPASSNPRVVLMPLQLCVVIGVAIGFVFLILILMEAGINTYELLLVLVLSATLQNILTKSLTKPPRNTQSE